MKTALHSVSYGGVWAGQAVVPLESVIEKAADFGYDGVMLMAKRPHASVLDLTAERRKALAALMADRGIAMAMLAGYNDFCGGAENPDIPYREMQVGYITALAKLARDLGGDKVRIFTGYDRPAVSYDVQWGWCVQCIKEAARRAADYGVTLCVQNHHDIAADHESLLDLLKQIDEPNCRAAFDAWAPALHGTDLAQAARAMGPQAANTTIADYVKRRRFNYHPRHINYERQEDAIRAVPMGQGFIDYRTFLKALRETGYSGYVVYEMCSALQGGGGEENLDRCARRFVSWMKENAA